MYITTGVSLSRTRLIYNTFCYSLQTNALLYKKTNQHTINTEKSCKKKKKKKNQIDHCLSMMKTNDVFAEIFVCSFIQTH